MRVAVLSKACARGGGASRVAAQLVHGLNGAGHGATHFVARSASGFTSERRPLYGPAPLRQMTAFGHYALRRLGLPEMLGLERPAVWLARIARDYDIVHAHDLGAAIGLPTLRALARRRPVFWTIHDCSPFTGGCLYPMACTRFRAACGACPERGAWPLDGMRDGTRAVLRAKAALHASDRVTLLAPSDWMADLAWSGGKLARRPLIAANGVDLATFQPIADRAALRRALDLPETGPIVLLSAGWLHETRKGIAHAIAALHTVADLAPFVLLVGDDDGHLPQALSGIACRATGYVDDPAALARLYAAADVFMFCSLADNQPLAVLETMSCATSMVGFATGGIPEMVEQEISGALVAQGDAAGLARALRHALAPGVAARRGMAARARAVQSFGMDRFIARHLQLYQAALGAAP